MATSLLTSSAFLRLACYHALGRAFTYELALQENHRLVTTGPYAYVRHPSYSAALVHFPMAMLSQLGPGSWWYESGCWSTLVGQLIGTFWVVFSVCFVVFVVQRAYKEDMILRMEFGHAWDEWRHRTVYMFIPGVY